MEITSRISCGSWLLLGVNLLMLAGQAGFGKQAALVQRGVGLHLFLLNPFYLLLMVCLALQAVLWPVILKRVSLGFAYGINTLSLPITLAISYYLFNESITRANVLGAGLIMAGLWIWAFDLQTRRDT